MTEDLSAFFAEPAPGAAVERPADGEVTHDRWGNYDNLPPVPGYGDGPWPRVSDLDIISDKEKLVAWEKRQIIRGLDANPDLFKPMRGSRFNPETSHGKKVINKIGETAQDAMGSHDGASLGTRFHKLAERLDRGEDPKTFETTPELLAMLKAYWRLRRDRKIKPVPGMMERVVFAPEIMRVGTFDSLNDDDGIIRIGDVKTQSGFGFSQISIPVQLACYARAEFILDPDTWTWVPMPKVDQDLAVVLWVPADDPGTAGIQDIDIVQGWKDALVCQWILERREDHTTIRQRNW